MGLDQKADDLCPLHRRRFLTASAALGAAVLIPGGVHAADVRDLAGSVKVNGKPATRKTRVRPGDVVETGPKSKVVFVIGQDAFLLREQSRLNLDKSKAGKEAVISGLRLVTGALLAVFGKGLRTIETATANAGIRGTGVYIEATPTETYFCTCYGEVELRDKANRVRWRLEHADPATGSSSYSMNDPRRIGFGSSAPASSALRARVTDDANRAQGEIEAQIRFDGLLPAVTMVELAPSQAMLWGVGKTLALEHPELWGGLVDLDPA